MKNLFRSSCILAAFFLITWAHVTVFAGPIEDGNTAYAHGDYKTALKLWLPPAEQGDGRAQAQVAMLYQFANGVKWDLVQAYKWDSLAVEAGNKNIAYSTPAAGAAVALRGITAQMTPGQLAEGQRLVAEWQPGSASAISSAQAQPNDWMLGSWTAQSLIPGFTPTPYAVNFVKNGNEIRAINTSSSSGAENLMRGVTDNFGVTTWQTWFAPMVSNGPCGTKPGEWVQASVQISPDHHTIKLFSPLRSGMPPCENSSSIVETDFTR